MATLYISLLEMLATVDHTTGFLDEFEHGQPKYQRARPPKKILFAGIIGYGCDIGHRKLAQMSKQIDENTLDNAVNGYFSLQNVQGGNDRILQFVDQMELPGLYWRKPGALHTKPAIAAQSSSSSANIRHESALSPSRSASYRPRASPASPPGGRTWPIVRPIKK